MSSNRKRVVTWPVLVAMLASPLLMNCGSLPGAGCKGDFKDPSSIAKLSFGLSADVEGKIKGALEAVANVQALAISLEADVQTACTGLAKDLGAKDDELKAAGKDTGKICDLAIKYLGTAKAEAKAAGKLTISAAPPVCGVSIDAAAECAGSCDASVKGGGAEVKCEGGEMSGACDAECSGSCDVSAGGECSGACEGSFSGTCDGDCEGQCDGKDAKGKCAGKCDGKCTGGGKGTCKGSCKLAAKAKCGGTCSGSCSVKFKEPKCSGKLEMPKVKAECKASCDAKLDAKVTCSPPAVKITFAGDAKAGAKLGAALEKNLPLLIKVVKGMAVKATAAVAKVAKAVADVKGALNGQALLKAGGCLAAGLKAQVAASASINVSVKASASASGSASSGLSPTSSSPSRDGRENAARGVPGWGRLSFFHASKNGAVRRLARASRWRSGRKSANVRPLDPGLRLSSVMTRCLGKTVLDDVSFALAPGRIHALMGENGAGKSTAIKLFAGLLAPDGGTVMVAGTALVPCSPKEATRRRVGLVHQHFSLIPSFTVLENLMLGHEPVDGLGILRPEKLRAEAEALMARTGLRVPLDEPTGSLGVGAKQRVEIVRILLRGARSVLLDEPTAILLPQEVKALYELLRTLADEGAAVGIVTHYVQEALAYADDVTVLRRGRVVSTGPVSEHTAETLSRAMLGEVPPALSRPPPPAEIQARLAVEGLTTAASAGRRDALRDVSFTVGAGEIVGVAGIDGNGQDTLVLALAGLVPSTSRTLSLDGRALASTAVRGRRDAGLEVVHGDRHRFGMVEDASLGDNLVLGDVGRTLEGEREPAIVEERLRRSGAVPAVVGRLMSQMSGGNQQKIVVERALSEAPKVLVTSYPTRGVDAAAATTIRQRLVAQAAEGAAILLVSADLAELRSLCHRLLVFAEGRIVATFDGDPSEEALGAAMLSRGGDAPS